jgi:hypothetical protein
VVCDLEHIDVRESARKEQRIDILLDVTGQQEASPRHRAEQHDRHAIDRRTVARRLARDVVALRPDRDEGDLVHPQAVAGGDGEAARCTRPRQPRVPRLVGGTGPTHAWLEHRPDAVAVQQQDQAGHMVLVRMGQHDRVDPPVPRGHPAVELLEEAIRVGPAVDKQPPATRALDEDGVALAHIEHGQAGYTRPPAGDDRTGQRDGDHQDGDGRLHARRDPRRRRWIRARGVHRAASAA